MHKESVSVGRRQFDVDQIFTIAEVRRSFRKALEAQEYQVGTRRVKRADLDKLWIILKAAEDDENKKRWDKFSDRSSRQILMTD